MRQVELPCEGLLTASSADHVDRLRHVCTQDLDLDQPPAQRRQLLAEPLPSPRHAPAAGGECEPFDASRVQPTGRLQADTAEAAGDEDRGRGAAAKRGAAALVVLLACLAGAAAEAREQESALAYRRQRFLLLAIDRETGLEKVAAQLMLTAVLYSHEHARLLHEHDRDAPPCASMSNARTIHLAIQRGRELHTDGDDAPFGGRGMSSGP